MLSSVQTCETANLPLCPIRPYTSTHAPHRQDFSFVLEGYSALQAHQQAAPQPRRQDSSVVRFGHRRVNDEHRALPGVAARRRTPSLSRSPASHPRIFALARSSQQPAQARPHTRPSKRIALAHAAARSGLPRAAHRAPRTAHRARARTEARARNRSTHRQLRARSWPASGARTGQARHGL